ncbi:uncharacterized protein LOC131294979 [Anopheles ziemanni]|uniref:uncharacterized protein LOC131294979 n=1 Tax=Anopheles ziemanni TaxID=345580 RepID=UPI00265D7238|nr:uncharacterized protein LOC131294979 [Anopheles ziemanni]
MWPMKLDMTKEECRGVLRRLELESYGSLISTFRAQGFLCKEKLRILEDLRRILHISNDRHRAEARRVANDERLYTVAEIICGPNSSQDWRREGHRAFPILPRSVPHTALTYIANTVYEQLTRANCKLPHPANTSCNRLKKAEEEMFKFELVRKELSLFEKGFERDAAVVTSDPLQDIMAKSYINIDVKRTEESKAEASTHAPEEVAVVESSENRQDAPDTTSTGNTTEQPSLSDILLDNSNSPLVASNTPNKISEKPNTKSSERSRKKSQGTKRQSKVKSPYPAGKPSKNGPVNSTKQSSKATSIPSPHLMHSYAVPFDLVSATNGGNFYPEPPQLQQHLTSNMPYPAPLGHSKGGGQTPSSPVHPSANYPPPSSGHLHSYKHQQGILPSSKKDIQYNLSKLNPTNSMPPQKGVNTSTVPSRGPNNFPSGAKGLPQALLNYQKRTNSKNILIPTSAAAATLASLGLPLAEHTSDWISSKSRDTAVGIKPNKLQQEISNPRVTLHIPPMAISSSPEEVEESSPVPSDSNIAGKESLSSFPSAAAHVSVTTSSVGDVIATNNPTQSSDLTSSSVPGKSNVEFGPVLTPPVVNNVLPLKQPNIAGFTPVKSGSKLSVSKTQLMPLVAPSPAPQSAPIGAAGMTKSNVFILPKSNVQGILNVGQKISISKCIVDPPAGAPAVTRSPPKVIVQPVPNLNNVASFDLDTDRKEATAQMRQQLFAPDKLSSEVAHVLTPMEIATGGLVKPVANVQPAIRSISVDGAPSIVPAALDAPTVRKITISASQLIPFKGTLRDGKSLPTVTIASNASNLPLATKQVKFGSSSGVESTNAPTIAASKPSIDWEQEVDRANGTQQGPPTAEVHNLPDNGEEVKEVVVKMDAIQETNGISQQHDHNSTETEQPTASKQVEETIPPSFGVISADRTDDSSATDSADAEEDPEDDSARIVEDDGIEEDDYDEEDRTVVDVETDTHGIIIEEDEANYDSFIEEVADDENYIEEIVDEQMEISYESSRELAHTSDNIIEEEEEEEEEEDHHPSMNGMMEDDQTEMMQYAQCTDMIADETVENGSSHEPHSMKDDIVCELLEIDADGTYSTRQFSYEQAIAEGLTVLPTMAKPAHKANRSVS